MRGPALSNPLHPFSVGIARASMGARNHLWKPFVLGDGE